MTNVGIDFGRHTTKATTLVKEVSFPSVVAPPVAVRFDNAANGVVEIEVKRKGKKKEHYKAMVGYTALTQSRGALDLTIRRDAQDVVCLVGEALWLVGIQSGDVVNLAVGAPVDYFGFARDQYPDWLQGQWLLNSIPFEVGSVHVMPEPAGTLFSLALNPDGTEKQPDLKNMNVAILDFGGYTTDCVVFLRQGNAPARYSENASFGFRFGVSDIVADVRAYLLEEHGRDLEPHTLHDPIRRRRIRLNETIDLGPVIDVAIKQRARYLSRQLANHWEKLVDIDRVYVTGGGASYFYPLVLEWDHTAELLPDSEFTNVRGFLAYCSRKEAE